MAAFTTKLGQRHESFDVVNWEDEATILKSEERILNGIAEDLINEYKELVLTIKEIVGIKQYATRLLLCIRHLEHVLGVAEAEIKKKSKLTYSEHDIKMAFRRAESTLKLFEMNALTIERQEVPLIKLQDFIVRLAKQARKTITKARDKYTVAFKIN